MSIFDEMRALASLDLTRNEMKVWLVYRAEMDEAARQVRGKTADQLRAKTDLGRAQFAAASAGLQEKGIIECRRQRNAPQVILVPELKSGSPENPDIRETQISGNIGCPETPESGSPENPDRDILAAPVSTAPIGVRARTSANFWSNAIGHGKHGYDGGVHFDGSRVELVNGTLANWLERFGNDREALDLALIQIVGLIQPNGSRPICAQVEGQLARIVGQRRDQDRRYEASKASSHRQQAKPTAAIGKPTVSEILKQRREAEAAA